MSALPPGPRGSLWQTAAYVRNPSAFYLRCARDYGDTFTMPSVLGPVVGITRPSHIKALFSLPPSDFEHWHEEAVAPLLGRSSLILTSGEEHLRQRRLMMPVAQHHREALAHWRNRIEAHAVEHSSRWPVGGVIAMQGKLVSLAMDVILESVLGVNDRDRARVLRQSIEATIATMGPLLMLSRVVHKRLGAIPYARFMRARGRMDALLHELLDEAPTRSGPPCMLDLLRSLRDEEGRPLEREDLRNQAVTLVFAGHDTTAIALTWAIYWLARDRPSLDRLRAEIQSAPDDPLDSLPYLDAVCREALRLHPTVPEVIRKLKVPLDLDGITLPAGLPVAACIVATHRRADIYDSPAQFNPERFLDRRYAPHEYLPFGGGIHRCVGEAFAMLTMKVILATLVRRFDFEVAESREVTPQLRSITMQPRGGVKMRVHPR